MKKNATIWIAFLSFAIMGLTHGTMGVNWPFLRDTFGVSLDAFGALITPAVIGSTIVSFSTGWLSARLGLARLMILGLALNALATVGFGLAPHWLGALASFALIGAGGAALEAGLNTYVATNLSARNMNWMHAFYGVGSTFGPLFAARVILASGSWRPVYYICAFLQFALLLAFVLSRHQWNDLDLEDAEAQPRSQAPLKATLRLPVAWLAITLFFLYAGVEVSTGQWSFTLFTEGRGADTQTAAFWVSAYWATFTGGRFLFGFVADRLRPGVLLQGAMAGIALGLALMWWNPLPWLGYLGLALAGFAMAPVYPTLMSDTPRRLGRDHAANAIGLQVAASGLGIGLLASGAGWLAEGIGIESIGAMLFFASVLLLLLFEALRRAAPAEAGPA